MRSGLIFGMALLGSVLALSAGEAGAQLNSGLGAPPSPPRAIGAAPLPTGTAPRLPAARSLILEQALPPPDSAGATGRGPATTTQTSATPRPTAASGGEAASGEAWAVPAVSVEPMPTGADPTAMRSADPRTAFLDGVAAYPPRRGDVADTLLFIGAGDDPAERPCRIYQQMVEIDGKPAIAYGKVCRQEDGTWKLVD